MIFASLGLLWGVIWDVLGASRSAPKRPKTAPRRPKTHPRRPKTAPKRPQDGPRRPKTAPRRLQDGPRWHQDAPRRPNRAQDGPKIVPRWIQGASDAARRPRDAPKRGPERRQDEPRRRPSLSRQNYPTCFSKQHWHGGGVCRSCKPVSHPANQPTEHSTADLSIYRGGGGRGRSPFR